MSGLTPALYRNPHQPFGKRTIPSLTLVRRRSPAVVRGRGFQSYRQCLNLEENSRDAGQPAHSGQMSPATGKPVPPMLATLGHPPTGERWAFESKLDGQRAIATTGSKDSALWSRNGNDISASFPEILDALSAVLDHRETSICPFRKNPT
ncbi:hypothetical protein ACIBM3_29015 [Rhodococcus erythropolis]|uniref:ATP-dependent DNA ligase n=1 Tax=Rhodococcus erythropolis TaxID=1833 RepID=UPI00379EB550